MSLSPTAPKCLFILFLYRSFVLESHGGRRAEDIQPLARKGKGGGRNSTGTRSWASDNYRAHRGLPDPLREVHVHQPSCGRDWLSHQDWKFILVTLFLSTRSELSHLALASVVRDVSGRSRMMGVLLKQGQKADCAWSRSSLLPSPILSAKMSIASTKSAACDAKTRIRQPPSSLSAHRTHRPKPGLQQEMAIENAR